MTTTTVYMLGGAFSGTNNYMPTMLNGTITNGNTQIQVPYNNFGMYLSTVQAGAQMLNTYLLAGTPPMVVFGHSLGAVVCNYWLSTYGLTTIIEPADLSFVWIGNSVSPYGGALGPETGAMTQNWFTNITVPSGTPFTCTDMKRQYHGWTDWPTGSGGGLSNAQLNAFSGQGSIHPNYQNVTLATNGAGIPNVTHVVGNITYIWSMTQPIAMLGTTWNAFSSQLDATLRPTIESAYSRPVTIPSPFKRTVNIHGRGVLAGH
jgi:hypothetical protein